MTRYPNSLSGDSKLFIATVDDISTAGSAWVVPGFRAKLKDLYCVIDGAIATAAATLTVKLGGVTLGTISVPFTGSAAGGCFFGTVTGSIASAEDQAFEVSTDGASSNAVKANVTLALQP